MSSPKGTVVKISAELRRSLIALAACASSDGTRPVLASINFSSDQAAATDSYVLGLVPLEDGPVEPRMLVARELAKALRGATKKSDVTIEFNGDCAEVVVDSPAMFGTTKVSTRLDYLEGKYPDYNQLIHQWDGVKGDPPWFNPKNLAKVAALAPPDAMHYVRVRWQDPMKPIRVEWRSDLLGLVMPVRER